MPRLPLSLLIFAVMLVAPRSSATTAKRTSFVNNFIMLLLDEETLSLHFTSQTIVNYPKSPTRGNVSIKRGRYLRYTNEVIPPLKFRSRISTRYPAKIFTDGSAFMYVMTKSTKRCRLTSAAHYPSDSIECKVYFIRSSGPVDCGLMGRRTPVYNCSSANLFREDPNWKLQNLTLKWWNYTTRYAQYILKFQRRPRHNWIRISLPYGLLAAITIGQLFVPITCANRLPVNVLIYLGMQQIFVSLSLSPIIGKYGGGALLGNLVATLFGFNGIIFMWSVIGQLLLHVFSASALPDGVVGLMDWLLDRAEVILFLPTAVIQQEERKAFSRRSDWFKLILLVDRCLIIVGIVVVVCAFQLFYKAV